jgi:PEP-CTERM motif-containing protein
LGSLAAGFLLLLVSATSASAQTQITMSNSSQSVSFQATSGTSMNVGLGCPLNGFTGTCTLSGNAFFDPGDIATYSFTTLATSSIKAANTGVTVFPISQGTATTAFSYTSADLDSLTGTVSWTDVSNGSANPHLNGILHITAVAGDAAFKSIFSGSTGAFDLILGGVMGQGLTCSPNPTNGTTTPNGGCNLENLFNNNFTVVASQVVSAGQMTAGPITPEPASMLLFGSGLIACGAFIRRRRPVSAVSV